MKKDEKELLEQGNSLIERARHIDAYLNRPNSVLPINDLNILIKDFEKTIKELPRIKNPESINEVFLFELKQRLLGEKMFWQTTYKSEQPSFDEIINTSGVPKSDIDDVEKWLKQNLDKVIKTNSQVLNEKHYEYRENPLLSALATYQEASELLLKSIDKVLKLLNSFQSRVPEIAKIRKEFKIVALRGDRSFTYSVKRIIGISIPNTIFTANGKLKVDYTALIAAVAEEACAHAVSQIKTEADRNLPEFIKDDLHLGVKPSNESVAEYFVEEIFDWLEKERKKTDFEIDIDEIVREHKKQKVLSDYWKNIWLYEILVLAQSKKEDFKNQMKKLAKYWIDPSGPRRTINKYNEYWDRKTGRLLPNTVRELIYCAKPVKRLEKEIGKNRLRKLENKLLEGHWSPLGLEFWIKNQ